MTGQIAHIATLCALAVALMFLAWTLVQIRKQHLVLTEQIDRCDRILKHMKVRNGPHLKLNRSNLLKHIEWQHVVRRKKLEKTQPILCESEWCRDNLTALPSIVVSPFDELDISLTFATPDDAFAYKMRWF